MRPLARRTAISALAGAALMAMVAGPLMAQGAQVGFAGLRQNPAAPVEVTSDSMSVEQAEGRAVFSGDVLVVQGDLRITAAEITVEYGEGGRGIGVIHARGGVTVVTPADAAEAREATYSVATGALVMTGDVLLTQGASAISGQRLVADLRTGTGTMEGRVRTVFTPGGGAGD